MTDTHTPPTDIWAINDYPRPDEAPPPGGWTDPPPPGHWTWADPATGRPIPINDPILPDWWKHARADTWAHGGCWPLTLAAVLTRAAAVIPPNIRLQAQPDPSPLNLFIVALAEPASGKSSGWNIARRLLDVDDQFGAQHLNGASPVSGAGLAAAYQKPGTGDQKGQMTPITPGHGLFHFSEAETLEKWVGRTGSADIPALLRQAWTGSDINHVAATGDRRRYIPAGTYTCSLLVEAQTDLTLPALTDHTSGTRQRFLWLPAQDDQETDYNIARIPTGQPTGDRPPIEPVRPINWNPPPNRPVTLNYHPQVAAHIDDHLAVHRHLRNPDRQIPPHHHTAIQALLDRTVRTPEWARTDHGKHTLLIRLRTAAVLAALRNPETLHISGVTPNDWTLAGAVLWMSARTAAHYTHRQTQIIADATNRHHAQERDTAAARQRGTHISDSQLADRLMDEALTTAITRFNGHPKTASDMWRETSTRIRRLLTQLGYDTDLWNDYITETGRLEPTGQNRKNNILYQPKN